MEIDLLKVVVVNSFLQKMEGKEINHLKIEIYYYFFLLESYLFLVNKKHLISLKKYKVYQDYNIYRN